MKKEKFFIWQDNEYFYERALSFRPNIVTYIHEENNDIRPCFLICPGGGYSFVSPSEGEIVAKRFYEYGFNAFVLTYTINPLQDAPLKKQPLNDVSRAIRFIRSKAKEFNIDSNKVAVCGFSAGGHLVSSIGVHFDDIKDNDFYSKFSNRPDALVLSYPVIDSRIHTHGGSMDSLIGKVKSEEELDYFASQNHVSLHTPPAFIWATGTDELVPVENSFLFAKALLKQNINVALHIFSTGRHGLSLADEVYADSKFGDPYTLEQNITVAKAAVNGEIEVNEEAKQLARWILESPEFVNYVHQEVKSWPELANIWLKSVFEEK